MDDRQFLNACKLREEGNLGEAVSQFLKVAGQTDDPIDKAGILLNAALTLAALRDFDHAQNYLTAVRKLISPYATIAFPDERVTVLLISIDLEEADISRAKGDNAGALAKYGTLLRQYYGPLHRPDFRQTYETIQTHRGFVLADLGSWEEALSILHEAESFQQLQAEIAFYLGCCYVAVDENIKAEQKLVDSLRRGLPSYLEARAHCALGMALYGFGDYARAKQELELGVTKADTSFIKEMQIWGWLAATCRKLGLGDEAQRYASLARPS